MAKKKNRKKHQFKYGQQQIVRPEEGSESAAVQEPRLSITSNSSSLAMPAYIRRDLVRVGVLAVSFVVGELVLWYLFNNTGLGMAVDRLIKL